MALKIDFYLLPETGGHDRLAFACRLTEKAYKNRHRVYLHAPDTSVAHIVDELLWTYREDSFLPHHLLGEGPDPAPPIQVGFGDACPADCDVLINLNQDVPAFFNRFKRILEIVPTDPALQTQAREHYRFYRTHGHTITTHKLTTIEV